MLAVRSRGKNERVTFAIFPKEGCWDAEDSNKINLSSELGKVSARTPKEAVSIAQKTGLGAGLEIWAIRIIAPHQVIAQG